MDVKLVVEKGSTKRQTWHLHHKDTVVGRRRDCDLRILSSEVSRRHCLLHIDDGYVNVEDLDSINGTFVNGSRVVGKQLLRPGDHLEVGPLEFVVEYEPPPGQDLPDHQRSPAQEPSAVEQAVYDVQPSVDEKSKSALDDEEGANWHLPQTNELRDLLSQMEQPEASPRP
jgi:pSer/pThr/pTyr-binding forkhead associated (FHA) protein